MNGGHDGRLVKTEWSRQMVLKTDKGRDVMAKSGFCRHRGWYHHRIRAPRLFLQTSQHILDWGEGGVILLWFVVTTNDGQDERPKWLMW